jgi:hypothetical protein
VKKRFALALRSGKSLKKRSLLNAALQGGQEPSEDGAEIGRRTQWGGVVTGRAWHSWLSLFAVRY